MQTAQCAPTTTAGATGSPSCDAPLACGTEPSGSTYALPVSTTKGTQAASVTQRPYGGTQNIVTTTSQAYSCTNGVQTAVGAQTSAVTLSGAPLCTAAAACGTNASGSNYSLALPSTSGTQPATTTQCSSGGTVPTLTTVLQNYTCSNGVQTAQGTPVSTTAASGNPTCNVVAGDTLTLNLSEDAYKGDAQFVAYMDGKPITGQVESITTHQPTGQSQAFTYQGSWGKGAHTVGVYFTNDNWDGTSSADGHDRNIFVTKIVYDGITTSPNGVQYSAGLASYPVKGAAAVDTLVLNLAEDAYEGDVQFLAYMDGKALSSSPQNVTVHQPTVKTQTFTYRGTWGSGAHTLKVQFSNDAWDGTSDQDGHDRNLFVVSVNYDGVVENTNSEIYSAITFPYTIYAH